jgi:hypothetical protein
MEIMESALMDSQICRGNERKASSTAEGVALIGNERTASSIRFLPILRGISTVDSRYVSLARAYLPCDLRASPSINATARFDYPGVQTVINPILFTRFTRVCASIRRSPPVAVLLHSKLTTSSKCFSSASHARARARGQ